MKCCYIAVGGNVGNVEAYLLRAIQALGCMGEVSAQSRLIETQPWGVKGHQDPYLNGVVEMKILLTADELLSGLFQIEAALGRNTREKGMSLPRPVDLDLIDYDGQIINREGLIVPHPRMHERLFVLEPLAEIAPDWMHPVLKKTIDELIQAAKKQTL